MLRRIRCSAFIFLILIVFVPKPSSYAMKNANSFDDYYSCLSGSNSTLYSYVIAECKNYKAKGVAGKHAVYAGCLSHQIHVGRTTLFSYIMTNCSKYNPIGLNLRQYNYPACIAHNPSTNYSARVQACKKYK
jgi:hypothetical protein